MILDKILTYKQDELAAVRRRVSLTDVKHRAADAEPCRDFSGSLKKPGFRIIAEVKKASPSAGVIREDFHPVRIAQVYEENEAAALSVLTDQHFFKGELTYLKEIRSHVRLPLLRKDFLFDEYQVYESRAAGADAVLLIVRILEDGQLRDYRDLAEELGLSVLFEVHDAKELERVLLLKPKLLGINNRDLASFKTDLAVTESLAARAAQGGSVVISESGISRREDLERLERCGVKTFLIGEALLREADFGTRLYSLLHPRT